MNELIIIQKQNEGMEKAFETKHIIYTQLTVDPDTPLLEQLKTYNEYLKKLSKDNRPAPQKKVEKVEKVEKVLDNDDDEEEPVVEKEIIPVYSTITNMEDIKRAFFSKEYDTFTQLLSQHPFKYYSGWYKYSSDNDGRPEYVAKNLLRGFSQYLDTYRKYFMVRFRCIRIRQNPNEYTYSSEWIVNSKDDLKTILGSFGDDYEFTESNEKAFIVEEKGDNNIVGEMYVH